MASLLVNVAHLRNLGHDFDEKSVARSLRAQRSVLVCLAGKERTVYGPVKVVLKVYFVEIRSVAVLTLDEDLAGQTYLGNKELALRVVGRGKVPAEAKLEADAVMTVQVSCDDGRLEHLRGMLDTGAGISAVSVSAWSRTVSPTLTPWTTAIQMANDASINVFGTTGPLVVRMAGLDLGVCCWGRFGRRRLLVRQDFYS